MSTRPVLSLSRVVKTYRAGIAGCSASVDVLCGVSLRVRAGELATVEGVKGSGKSTLLLCAAGMVRPDEGDVRWPAHLAGGYPPAGISYVSDRTPAHGFLTVRESIAFAVTVCELRTPGRSANGTEMIALAGLREHANARQALLPEAVRARLLVAVAMVQSPRLLLVDDLDGGAGAEGRTAFAQFLSRIAASGTAVLWAATAVRAVDCARTAYVLRDGRLRRASPRSTFAATRPQRPRGPVRDALVVPPVACGAGRGDAAVP